MMNKILTIVIPTYNMEKLLPRCLDSLISPQTSEYIEVLVVNDGSKDNSLAVAQKYATKFPSIVRIIDKENGNYGSAVNKGIDEATGKYFRILDADDFYDNNGLMRLISRLKDLDVDIILTNYRRDRGSEKRFFSVPSDICNHVMPFGEVDIDNLPNFAMHGITYRTSILQEHNIRLQTGISYTDSEFCFYPLKFIRTFIALDIVVYCYQLGRAGQTVEINSQLKGVGNMAKILRRMHDYIIIGNFDEATIKKLVNIYCNVTSLCFLTELCFDRKNSNLHILDNLRPQILDIPGADELMLNSHLFGVKYYKRYIERGRTSHGIILTCYYKLIKASVKMMWKLKNIPGLVISFFQ